MVPIYICDDNGQTLAFIKSTIERYLMIKDYDMHVTLATSDPNTLLNQRTQEDLRSIYFLDVDLAHTEFDGFTLAKALRKIDTRGFFIFVTTHEELIFETFKYRLEAMSYLTKENPAHLTEQIQENLDEIYRLISQERGSTETYYTIQAGERVYQLPLSEIYYFETSERSHFLRVYGKDRIIEFRGNLQEIEEELTPDFCKVHRSFLVNLAKIKYADYKKAELEMINGATCFISRKGKRLLKERLEKR
ncbi:LytR/AlgR family response regulator transcription factor [Enterococcus sp. DIV0756]|uniref:LytR/AlgR family response regulator transcription factor n=1 Tax=Enterococcus sp. DIV0756 TaxID=2774636 RepID=UPI003F24FAA4